MIKTKKTNQKFKLTSYILLAFLLGILFVKAYGVSDTNTESFFETKFFIEEEEIVSVVEEVLPAVVSVSLRADMAMHSDVDPLFAGQANEIDKGGAFLVSLQGNVLNSGTGFLVGHDGTILTNKHVAYDESVNYVITFDNGEEYLANVFAVDPLEDIAVLKIIGEDLYFEDVLNLADSSTLKVGQSVLAIGNALTLYGNTVTSGIISAINREIVAYNDFTRQEISFTGLIQTDAAINLGNSGGPLINLDAEVVGMNVAIAESANNIGFALSASSLVPVIESLNLYGEIRKPFLGLRFVTLNSFQAQELGLPVGYGAILLSGSFLSEPAVYPNGPADKAGLKEEDIILGLNNYELNDAALNEIVAKYKVGDTVLLKVWRAGVLIDVEVVLEDFSNYVE